MIKSLKYIYEGIHTLAQGKIEVPVLDGTAIGVSIIRRDINTASSIMFLLGIGEILEDGHIRNPSMILQKACP